MGLNCNISMNLSLRLSRLSFATRGNVLDNDQVRHHGIALHICYQLFGMTMYLKPFPRPFNATKGVGFEFHPLGPSRYPRIETQSINHQAGYIRSTVGISAKFICSPTKSKSDGMIQEKKGSRCIRECLRLDKSSSTENHGGAIGASLPHYCVACNHDIVGYRKILRRRFVAMSGSNVP